MGFSAFGLVFREERFSAQHIHKNTCSQNQSRAGCKVWLPPKSHNSTKSASSPAGLFAIRAHLPWRGEGTQLELDMDRSTGDKASIVPRSAMSSTPGSPQTWAASSPQLEFESWIEIAEGMVLRNRTAPAICRAKSHFWCTPLKQRNPCLLKFISLCLQQMSLGVAKLRLLCWWDSWSSEETLPKKPSHCLHRYKGTQIWHLGPGSGVPWAEEQIQQLVQSAANSPWHLMGKATDQPATGFGMEMLLVPWETAFPNKQNAALLGFFSFQAVKTY